MRQSILDTALRLSNYRCDCSNYHHFCVLFRGKKIIATGFNCFCRNLKHLGAVFSVHAELNALQKVKDKRRSFDMLVIRTNITKTSLLNSKPCLRCEMWIKNYPVNKIYFSNDQGGISFINSSQLPKSYKHNEHHRPVDCKDVCCIKINLPLQPLLPLYVASF